MKITELRQQPKEELERLFRVKRARIDELRPLLHEKKTKNVKETRMVKKDIARILTLLQEQK